MIIHGAPNILNLPQVSYRAPGRRPNLIKNNKDLKESRIKLSTKFILKTLFIAICCGVCCYQMVDVLAKYSSYPMDVNVIVEDMKLLQLPGITLCNNNIIFRSNFIEEFPELGDIFKNLSLREIADYTTKYMNVTPLSDILYLSSTKDEFIDDMECDSELDPTDNSDNKKKTCSDKKVIRTLQKNGVCFTYFHRMARYVRGKNDNCRWTKTCVNKEPIFDNNEIARFELDFRPHEYTSKDLPISGRIVIHDNTELEDSLTNAYNLEPGYYYQFFIKLQSASMLKKPYATNCLDYIKENAQLFNSTPDFTSVPLSRAQCSILCISKYSLKTCECWPPEMPYVKDNQLDPNKTNSWCQWKFDMERLYSYGTCFSKLERLKCSIKCQPSCWRDHYEITVQKLSFEYYGRDGWTSEDLKLKKRKSVISIRYWTSERTTHEYSPMFKMLDMLCYLGGVVSMYTGFSFIALYDYVTTIFFITKKYI